MGEHSSIREVGQQIQKIAATDTTCLLLGESGTGKELFALAIHHLSSRRQQPFVALNCAAIPEGLVENELFGHEKGAFTGAATRKVGKMDLAHRGTLFLDEIGELPLAIQAKLLRVLEEKRFERVGGTRSIDVDARIIVATNRDLQKQVQEKLFRDDLYFRISTVPITIPPLRERGNDVLLLANHFLNKFSREFAKPGLELSEDARERLLHYRWPGNVRELQNTMERAVILAEGVSIRAEALQMPATQPDAATLPAGMLPDKFDWGGTLEQVTSRAAAHVEKALLENTMREYRWNKTRAAERLGITPKTLLAKLRAAGLEE
jgi:transcriptional regulator with GAF, ATPase, and Fis domain